MDNSLFDNICMCGNPHTISASEATFCFAYAISGLPLITSALLDIVDLGKFNGVLPEMQKAGLFGPAFDSSDDDGCPGRREWIRTNDPYHVKVVL